MKALGSGPIAVAGDASAFHREPRAASALTAMLATAAVLHEHTGLDTTAVLVPATRVDELISGLRRIAPGVAAIYLVHTDPARARAAQDALRGTVPVITEEQTAPRAASHDPIAPLLAVPELLSGSSCHRSA